MAHYGLAPIMFESVSAVTATNTIDPGTRVNFAGNDYLYVYNAGNSAIAPGCGATVSAVSGYSVTVSSTVSNMVALGVCKHASIPTGYYGWLMTRGFCNYEAQADAAVTAGETLKLAADGTWVNASGITGPAYGKAMIATASGGSAGGYFSF